MPAKVSGSVVLIENNSYHTKSSAALRIARRLKGAFKLGYAAVILPKFLRDKGYDVVARNRYKWFGKQDQCRLPTPEIRSRFL